MVGCGRCMQGITQSEVRHALLPPPGVWQLFRSDVGVFSPFFSADFQNLATLLQSKAISDSCRQATLILTAAFQFPAKTTRPHGQAGLSSTLGLVLSFSTANSSSIASNRGSWFPRPSPQVRQAMHAALLACINWGHSHDSSSLCSFRKSSRSCGLSGNNPSKVKIKL